MRTSRCARRCRFAACCVAVVSFSAMGGGAEDARFSRNGFLIVDGEPRLIIGSYELPAEDVDLAALAANGFNLVRASADTKTLDRARAHGLHAWICLGGAVSLAEDDVEAGAKLTQLIERFKDHPAMLVWELPDESLWNTFWSRHTWIQRDQRETLRKRVKEQAGSSTPEKTPSRSWP